MEDGDDVDAIRLDAINQTIGMRDQFAPVVIFVLGHDAPGAWMVDQLLDAPRELVDHLNRIERSIAIDEVADADEVRLGLIRPSFRQAVLSTNCLVVGYAVGIAIGDPGRTYLPKDMLVQVACYAVPVSRDLEDAEIKNTAVWRLA